MAGFLIFQTFFGKLENIALCLKNILKKWTEFVFGNTYLHQTFTESLVNFCQYILMYWHARCDSKLWKALWLYCVFWVFSYIIDKHSCLKYCIFIKLSQIVCLIIVRILVCQHAKCDCRLGRFSVWTEFFGNFHIF